MNDNTEIMIPEEVIMRKIYLLRGQKVMLDKDLAERKKTHRLLAELLSVYGSYIFRDRFFEYFVLLSLFIYYS